MRNYSSFGHQGGNKSLFSIIIGIAIGIAVGYFANIYLTESFAFFQYKSLLIGAASGALTAIVVHAISTMGKHY